MREIKFRAWDLRNNKWFHQDLFIMTNAGFYPDFREFDDGQSLWDHEFELMQYTGLTDKNGVEIYEGDILTSEEYPYQDEGVYNYHGIVEYAEEIAAFVVVKRVVNQKMRGISDGMADYFEEIPFEVIGNIYENPELLEGDTK